MLIRITNQMQKTKWIEESEDEDKIDEGNQFSKALRTARKEGKSTFTVDGKEYTVEDYEDEMDEAIGLAK